MSDHDIDTPVDEALLMGGESEEFAPEDLERIAGEEEAEPEAEEAAAGEPAAEDGEKAEEHKPEEADRRDEFIPKARFNEVNEERKQLREELERMRAAQQPPEPDAVDIKALRREATSALLEGDQDKHDALQDKIDAELMRQAEARAEEKMLQRQEASEFRAKAAALTKEFPVLNPETGDPEAITLVVELRDAYIAKGMPMTQALETAVRKIAPRFQPKSVPAADPETPDPRKAEAVKRGARASNSIPPAGGGVGNRAMPPAASNEPSQAEWDSMTPAQRQKALEAAA